MIVTEHINPLENGKQLVAVFIGHKLMAVVVAEQLMLPSEIVEAYCRWTGFDKRECTVTMFGHNVLTMKTLKDSE